MLEKLNVLAAEGYDRPPRHEELIFLGGDLHFPASIITGVNGQVPMQCF